MDKSKIVSVRLSNDELNVIEDFRKQFEMKTQNDVFRYSLAFTISCMNFIAKLVSSQELNGKNEKFIQEFYAELEKMPETQANLKEQYHNHEKEVLSKIDEEIDKGVEIVKPFAQERNAGRPSKLKSRPGRPKEQGY